MVLLKACTVHKMAERSYDLSLNDFELELKEKVTIKGF